MGSDWDASSSDEDTKKPAPSAVAASGAPKLAPAVPAKKSRFADEDASDDDAKSDWDVSDDEDKPKKAPVVVGSMRNKGATAKKIAAKEEEERKKAEEAERMERENDPAALRAKARAAQLKSDMDSAASLFGESTLNDNPLDMNCRTKEDFTALASAVADSLIQKHAGNKLFGAFVDELTRNLGQSLKSEEVGKIRASMAGMAMEKQKQEKSSAKGPGGKPAARMMARGKEDLSQFGVAMDDEAAQAEPASFNSDDDFAGVVTGKNLIRLFEHARENHYAIPAFNVTSSSTAIAALEGARDSKSPVILQVSQGGAAMFAGKGIKNDKQQASIAGAVAAAAYIRAIAPTYGIPVVLHSDHCAKKLLPWFDGMLEADEAYYKEKGEPLFSSHMLDLSEESKEENIETCVKYFQRMAKIELWLEMEIGITGGEEDGVDNTGVDNASLYTQPEDILDIHNALFPISPAFSIAAGFGNVHGVYKPGNVKLRPELLQKHQEHAAKELKSENPLPIFLVFHGGSGSSKQEITTAVTNGVVKMNVDTDTQWAYMEGHRDYFLSKQDYLKSQVGNPDGADKPNKKFADPRVWVREGELTMKKRVEEALKDLLTENRI
ncbi:hypothetical protein JCM11251_005170 [Rhodosporidiobolus azoricus]